MALSALIDDGRVSTPQCAELVTCPGHNDAFSFWKLPHDWAGPLASAIGESRAVAEYYLFEEYLAREDRQPPPRMQAYYRVKRLIPAAVRHRLNSAAIKMRGRREFPRWPCESALIDYWRDWLRFSLRTMNASDGWHIGFWPGGMNSCVVLTHDVEGPIGMRQMERMADLEERYNFRSAWNLPLAQYEIDWNLVGRLRQRGFEFGAHGLSHDGRLFRSAGDFSELAPILQRLARDRGLIGFRAPSTLRRAEWIGELRVRLRLQLLGFRSVRAAAGRNLQRVSFLSREPGRAAVHDAAGSHVDSPVAPPADGSLGGEGALARVSRRDDSDSGSS